MLGFSLTKLIVLVAIIAAVWYGFKWISRYNRLQQAKAAKDGGDGDAIEDMVKCPHCEAYYPSGGAHQCNG